MHRQRKEKGSGPSPIRRRPTVINQLTVNDVILGRGSPATGHIGNIRFREVIRSLIPQYTTTSRRAEKDRLARQVIYIVRSRQGRFVRRVESPAEADSLDLDSLDGVWILEEDEQVIIPKVKQTFRDQHSEASSLSNDASGSERQREVAVPGQALPFDSPYTGMLTNNMFSFPLNSTTTVYPGFQGNLNTTIPNGMPFQYIPFAVAPQLTHHNPNNLPTEQDLVLRNQLLSQITQATSTQEDDNLTQGLDILAQAAIDRRGENSSDRQHDFSDTSSDE